MAPGLSNFVGPSLPSSDIHTAPVYLPSMFSDEQRAEFDLQHLAEIEGRVRISLGHELLAKLRTTLGLKGLYVRSRYDTNEGIEQVTRSQAKIARVSEKVQRIQKAYMKNFNALMRLHIDLKSYTAYGILQELKDDDLVMLRQWSEVDREVPGTTQKGLRPLESQEQPIPWFWRLVGGGIKPENLKDIKAKDRETPQNKTAPNETQTMQNETETAQNKRIAQEILDYNYRGKYNA